MPRTATALQETTPSAPTHTLDGNHLERILPTQATIKAFLDRYQDHRQRYEFATPYIQGKHVADIASGAGYGSHMMGAHAASVTGFDIDPTTIAHANTHFSRPNVSFAHANSLGTARFDTIISFETLEHMSEADGDTFLQNLRNALKPGGTLLLSTPLNRSSHRHNTTPFHIREYDDAELKAKLEANGFKVIQRFGQCNSWSQAFNAPVLPGLPSQLSLRTLTQSGLQKLVPTALRQKLRDLLLGQSIATSNSTVTIVPDDLSHAFVQICLCRPH